MDPSICAVHQPLVNLCLDTVVENFHRYNAVYSTAEDGNTKRKFEFLQRKYSLDLLRRLCSKDDLPEEFIDILINKYLKFLDTSWFRKCPWDKVTSKIAEMGSNVEKVFFQDVYFEEFCEETPWQDIICHLPNLKSLIFHDDCHDLILKNVAKFCPEIEEININNSSVTFEGVKYLCKGETGKAVCTKLKKLYIASTPNIKDDDVKYLLKNLPSLEIIDYLDLPLVLYSLHKNDLPSIDKVEPYNITSLDLMNFPHHPFFNDILKVCLSVCPHLKVFTCAIIKEEALNFFFNLSALEHLHLENYSDSNININNLLKSKGGKLTSLMIVNFTVSMSVLAESCIRIEELNFNKVNFHLEDDSKPVFNLLSSLTFQNINVSTNARAISLLLSSSAKLESLSFKMCHSLSSETKVHILKYCELYPIKKISFCCSVIEKEYIKDLLLNCHTLTYLNIDSCLESDDEDELLRFSEILSNKLEIDVGDQLDISDYEEYLNGNYELDDDYDYDDYDNYDDHDNYDDYDYDAYDTSDSDDD